MDRLEPLRAMLAVAVLAVMGAAHRAHAACTPTRQTANFEVKATDCHNAREFFHYLSSRGSYATAVTGGRIPQAATCQIDSGIRQCLKYTGQCSTTVSPSTGCTADPSYQPGEISCWCQAPVSTVQSAALMLGQQISFTSVLRVDTDLDSQTDLTFCPSSTPIPFTGCGPGQYADAARMYELHPEYYRIEWEDRFPPGSTSAGSADYNDYIMGWEFRDCRPDPESHFPESAQTPAICASECGTSCDDATLSTVNAHVRVTAGLTVDAIASELDFEPNGRLLQLTVNAYADFLGSDPNLNKFVAICPVLNLRWLALPGSSAAAVPMLYGTDKCGGQPGQSAGTPVCLPARTASLLHVAGSQQQRREHQFCGPWDPIDESFRFRAADTCTNDPGINSGVMPVLQSQQYEFRIDDIDRDLTQPLRYGGLEWDAILDQVESVDVYLFWDIDPAAAPFICPSGARVFPGDALPSTAKMFKYNLRSNAGLSLKRRL